MVKLLSRLSLIFLFFSAYLNAEVTAEVDRFSLYQGERLTLMLKSDQQVDTKPDLTALQQDFQVISSNKITISSHQQSNVNTRTHWELRLRPINEGRLSIPTLTVGADQSPEIALNVLPAADNPSPQDSGLRPVYIEVSADKDSVYVGEQTILSVKVFHLAPLPLDTQLSRVSARNAQVKALQQRKTSQTTVNGQPYFVTEYSYALYPRAVGTVEVEPIFFNTPQAGGTLDLTSSLLLIDVQAPAFSNTQNLWLPAQSVYIEDNLSRLTDITVGESLRRTITIEAQGLPASSLPALPPLNFAQVGMTLENVVLDEQITEQGIISQRMEEWLITPEIAADIQLPALDIPWWNTKTGNGENAAIAGRTIRASAALPPPVAVHNDQTLATTAATGQSTLLIWLLALISIAASVGLIYSWNRNRHPEPPELTPEDIEQEFAKPTSNLGESHAFNVLLLACQQNNTAAAQLRLIEWAKIFWQEPSLNSIEQVCQCADNNTFNFLVLDLAQHIYEGNTAQWQGDLLLEALEKIRDRQLNRLHLHPGEDRLRAY